MSRRVEDLRGRLADVDGKLVKLVAERRRLVSRIGRAKREAGMATRDYRQEREVFDRVRAEAAAEGVEGGLIEDLFSLLIQSSLTLQERDRVAEKASGSGQRALVIGGCGRMGAWFVRFLASQGFDVEIADPETPAEDAQNYRHVRDWRDDRLDQDVIVVAAPLEASKRILAELPEREPRGLVFDVASLKGPLRQELSALVEAGVRVTSIHPMFGPDTDLLSNRHVIFVDLGLADATAEAKQLFAPTMASLVDMELDQHDRLIAFVLGLSHALNVAFSAALAESGEAVPKLAEISSTTFDAQLEVASRVASDSPELYFEIQSLNEYGGEALDALAGAVERIREAVARKEPGGFVELMLAGRRYLEERRGAGA